MAELISILRANPITSMLFGMIIVAFAKGLLAFFVGTIVILSIRKLTANQKHIIWFIVIVLFVVIPISWLVAPAVNLDVPVPAEQRKILRSLSIPLMSRDQYIERVILSDDLAVRGELFPTYGFSRLPWSLIILIIWALGIVFFLVRLITSKITLIRLIGEAKECTSRRFLRLLNKVEKGLAIKSEVHLLRSPRCNIPFAYGLLKPVILLPWQMREWSDQRLEAVLRHELAHVKRKDCLTQLIGRVVCALFWFVPIVWIAYRRLLLEQEKSCDAYVLNSGIRGPEYAGDLVQLVRGAAGVVALPGLYNTLAKKSIVKERIKSILSFHSRLLKPQVSRLLLSFFILTGCLIPIFAVTFTTRPSFSKTGSSFYGVWINTEYSRYYYGRQQIAFKTIHYTDGTWTSYHNRYCSSPVSTGRRTVSEKWTDDEGNVWYKSRCEYEAGGLVNYRFARKDQLSTFELHRVSRSGEIWEYMSNPDRLGWPTSIDPQNPEYRIYYRQKGG